MYSGSAFGEFAFGEHEETPPDSEAFEAFLADVAAARCWLLEIDALSLATIDSVSGAFSDAAFGEVGFCEDTESAEGGVQTLRFSTHGYTTHGTDTPARVWYDVRLSEKVVVDRRIAGRNGIGGLAKVYAEASLTNVDGALDALKANFSLDGRAARIPFGRPTDALSAFGALFSGVVSPSPQIGTAAVMLKLSDGQAKLARPVNLNTYLGTGGLEGGADLLGKYKPKGYGHVFGISPPCVDTANLIYQVNDGPVSDVPQAFDRGIALTKVPGAPAPGQYQVDTAAGTVKLGVKPSGTFTCNALLDASPTYVDSTADIILRILGTQAGLVSTEIEPGSFVRLNTDAPAEVGTWAGTEGRTIADMVDELLANCGAFGGFNRQGAFSVAVLTKASGAPRAVLKDDVIIDVQRDPLPGVVEPLAWRCAVGYQKNYTVQNDLAAGVTAAQTAFAAEPVRVAEAKDEAVRSRHLLARDYADLIGLYAEEADADAEALRRFALWSGEPALYRVKARPVALTLDLGQVVELRHARHNMALGVSGRVIAHRVSGTEVELMVLV